MTDELSEANAALLKRAGWGWRSLDGAMRRELNALLDAARNEGRTQPAATFGDVIDRLDAAWGAVKVGMSRREVFDAGFAAGWQIVGEAAVSASPAGGVGSSGSVGSRAEARTPSRAAIAAMREPTEVMLSASEFYATGASREDVVADFTAMIDSILNTNPEGRG